MDPVNFLAIELATLGYCLYAGLRILTSWETTPGHMAIAVVLLAAFGVHVRRFLRHYNTIVRKDEACQNITLIGVLAGLLWIARETNNTLLAGLLTGLVMIESYTQKQLRTGRFKWIEPTIDLPITIAGMAISWVAVTQNTLLLFPMVGDLVYHLTELL